VDSSSGRSGDNAGERDKKARGARGGKENAGLVFNNGGQEHNKLVGNISRNVQPVEASGVEYEAGSLHSGVEQPMITTQAERWQQKERDAAATE
jgi:hypothetical protein